MMLDGKNAVVYWAGGAIGGAVARAFAREGARVFLAGQCACRLDALAADLTAAGGEAEAADVDPLDPRAVVAHADAVADRVGRIDVTCNAVGLRHARDDDEATYTRAQAVTTTAAARYMARQRSGVILTLRPGTEADDIARRIVAAAEPSGVRVATLTPDAGNGSPEAVADQAARLAAEGATGDEIAEGSAGGAAAAE